jgi:hypothetical protein
MSYKEILERAYGNVPKETPWWSSTLSWIPEARGIKYYYIKLVRFFTR